MSNIKISSHAGHRIKIENGNACLYDDRNNLIGAFPHRQQAEVYIYTFNHGYQRALYDIEKGMKDLIEKLCFGGTLVYPPEEEEEGEDEEDRGSPYDLAQEMCKWGLTLIHNYAKDQWEVIEMENDDYNYITWITDESWDQLKDRFEIFKQDFLEKHRSAKP